MWANVITSTFLFSEDKISTGLSNKFMPLLSDQTNILYSNRKTEFLTEQLEKNSWIQQT